MNPIMTVEFSAKTNVAEIKEESVPLHNPEELFAFVAPGVDAKRYPMKFVKSRWFFLNQNTLIQRILSQINV